MGSSVMVTVTGIDNAVGMADVRLGEAIE